MKSYFAQESLQGDNQYECEACGRKRDASKATSLSVVPEVAILQFERKLDPNHKVKTHVELPLELDLDLDAYAANNGSAPASESDMDVDAGDGERRKHKVTAVRALPHRSRAAPMVFVQSSLDISDLLSRIGWPFQAHPKTRRSHTSYVSGTWKTVYHPAAKCTYVLHDEPSTSAAAAAEAVPMMIEGDHGETMGTAIVPYQAPQPMQTEVSPAQWIGRLQPIMIYRQTLSQLLHGLHVSGVYQLSPSPPGTPTGPPPPRLTGICSLAQLQAAMLHTFAKLLSHTPCLPASPGCAVKGGEYWCDAGTYLSRVRGFLKGLLRQYAHLVMCCVALPLAEETVALGMGLVEGDWERTEPPVDINIHIRGAYGVAAMTAVPSVLQKPFRLYQVGLLPPAILAPSEDQDLNRVEQKNDDGFFDRRPR
ncbi:unnamed protein product [Vitrella brassicaformis CCMP3155]|uniref:Uncharacterized protein n=1 Tax=Vitrella brassicaformis (strain CCMP3155) TaxID=1169540 RepID=A0A0G4GUA7_VITBC|nr:unnamed protein product [Vitrella brassicaformis CCMP3155]|eukprot:CEM34419.1 unnamed protein product [Vitrella brassicaformis CCMP3155]